MKKKLLYALLAVVAFAVPIYVGAAGDMLDGAFLPSTLTSSYTLSGNNTFSGTNTFSGQNSFTKPDIVTFATYSTTATLQSTDRGALVSSANGAWTLTVPAATAGRVVPIYMTNGTDAVTVTNVNHTTTAELNAIGENITLIGNGTTYLGVVNNQ